MYSKVYVEITNICNKNCSFCPGTSRPLRRMTMDEFTVITEKLKGITEYIYYHLMGEPLTHPLLPDFIKHASSMGYRSIITTNGSLLEKRGCELISVGVYKVNISVHSFEDGTDEEYLTYINNCLDFADEASAMGVIVILRLWNRGYDEGRNIDTLELIKARFDGEWKESSRGFRIRPRLHIEYGDRFDWPDITAPFLGNKVFCYGLKDQLAILSDGRVVPCCLDREGVVTLGNIFESDVREILSSPRAVAMREGFMRRFATEELCRRCSYARRFG